MFWNYLKIALRNLRKNKLFSVISILGLTTGMTVYIFGNLVVEYESSYDDFFSNSDRIYTIGSSYAATSDSSVSQMSVVHSAVGPIVDAELSDLELVVRSRRQEFLMGTQAHSTYEPVLFVDSGFLQLFDFTYLAGGANAFDILSSAVISETKAIEYFGRTQVLGEIITLGNKHDLTVSAVIADIPSNSHFNSVPWGTTDVFVPLNVLASASSFELEGDWWGLNFGNITYVMLPEHLDATWLQIQMDDIFDRFVPIDKKKNEISGFFVEPLRDANLAIWNMLGLPVPTTVLILSILVLVIACVNYSNLAIAQSMGRSREVGMRKALGAKKTQLLAQFMVESILVATIAMFAAIAILELMIPIVNHQANTLMNLNYLQVLPKLAAITLSVGLLSGFYPAWIISRSAPTEVLKDSARKGKKGVRVRAFMIGAQFGISAFMLAVVAVVYLQGEKVVEASHIFPRSQIYTLNRLDIDEIQERFDILKYELEALPSVEHVAFSSQVPFQQSNTSHKIAAVPGDEANAFWANELSVAADFFSTYDIPLLAGRDIDISIANDQFDWDRLGAFNVLINELTMTKLGFDSPDDAINQRFYWTDAGGDEQGREFVIVGVVPTQNIHGFYNEEKPWVFVFHKARMGFASLRINGNISDAMGDIEIAWNKVVPDYPIQGRFLDEVFDEIFSIFQLINVLLGVFSLIASALAMFGLFGLAAYMSKQRTREIGIRKVLGANAKQVTQLLIWQFSKPVIWGLIVALPAAFFASNIYLDFFADRLESPVLILLAAGLLTVILAWITVAGHAYQVARANPISALRHE